MPKDDFFSQYLQYASENEVPTFFHRWCAIATIGALLGRRMYFQHGHMKIMPNIYCMLIGEPGTRKSTGIKMIKQLIRKIGYDSIAADKTTKEKFLLDLGGYEDDLGSQDLVEQNLFGTDAGGDPRECFIMADEFNDFFGNNTLEFISLLGSLWDYDGVYESRIKNGKSVTIPDPTISILGGNTPVSFTTAFPPESLGQGFFSRLILVYSESSGRKITFPALPTADATTGILQRLTAIRGKVFGEVELTHSTKLLIDKIYKSWQGIDDVRFDHYSNRRFTHLLKLCTIMTAARESTVMLEEDVVYANTVLTHTEHSMPKALGEFGKARHSDVGHKIMSLLQQASVPLTFKDLWANLHNDLEKMNDLAGLLQNLTAAGRIFSAQGGFLPKRKALVEVFDDVLDYSLLTAEEKGVQ